MATYFRLLLTLTPTVRDRILTDAGSTLRAENDINVPGVQCLGLYGLQRDDDAHLSLEFGVRAGAHITTLPAVPIGELSERERPRAAAAEATIRPPQPPEPPAPHHHHSHPGHDSFARTEIQTTILDAPLRPA